MTSAQWAPGTFGSPTVGNYENAANWVGFVVPDETAVFGPTFTPIVVLTTAISVGAWNVGASYNFVVQAPAKLTFTGTGVTGGGLLTNAGTVTFANASTAGAMALIAAPTGTINFNGNSTAGYAALITQADSGQLGRINFNGSGPAGNHKLTAGSLSGDGIFNLGSNQLTVGTDNTAETTVSGQIIGAHGSLVFDGNILTLDGNNTYGGGTTVLGGQLIVNGKIGNVTFGHTANNDFQYGMLEGNGVVGKVTGEFGEISAGAVFGSPGQLKTHGLKLKHLSGLAVDIAGIGDPGPGGYDQIVVKGKVTLSGGDVNVGTHPLYTPGVRFSLTVIDNDGTDRIAGTFGGGLYGPLREGDAFVTGSQVYSITYKGGTGNDVVLRSEGALAGGSASADTINKTTSPSDVTTKHADYVYSSGGDDTVDAAGGNDTVSGGYGKDELNGGAGNDFVTFDDTEGGTGVQVTLKGSNWAIVQFNGQAWDKVKNFENLGGSAGPDSLTGDGRDNIILGGEGKDTLKGASGNDVLVGGYNKDKLTGGDGRDKFVFSEHPGGHEADKIADFSHGQDTLLLNAVMFEAVGPKLEAREFYAAAGATKAHDADDRIISDTHSGKLYYDDDGPGGHNGVLFATLTNHATLTASDFIVIV